MARTRRTATLPSSNSSRDAAWTALTERLGELEALGGLGGLASWDQQVMMPKEGAPARGRQQAVIQAIQHERFTDPRVGEWLETLSGETDPVRAAAVRNARRAWKRARELPTALVRDTAEACAAGFAAWIEAREARSFEGFRPALERIVGLVRQAIDCHGPADHPYDHLLEDNDPGTTAAQLRPMFRRLADGLRPLVAEAAARARPPVPALALDREAQIRVSRRIVDALGFRLAAGRLDVSEHPFTCGLASPADVRLTTRYLPTDPMASIWATIHETGHGLYEQGLPARWAGTGLCSPAGVGLHESQSRFWENNIGRSQPFCRWLCRAMDEEGASLGLTPEALFALVNRVEPSLVRVAADEATYNLHIIVRFELELRLVSGELTVADLPEAWDDAYERTLGLRPPDPVLGVMQDVHWGSGIFGYFPSYTVGNLYAASFAVAMERDVPGLWEGVERGEFAQILGWLRAKVHDRGHIVDAPEIFADAVGPRDPVADLLGHLRSRQEQAGA